MLGRVQGQPSLPRSHRHRSFPVRRPAGRVAAASVLSAQEHTGSESLHCEGLAGNIGLKTAQYQFADRSITVVKPTDVDAVLDWYIEQGVFHTSGIPR